MLISLLYHKIKKQNEKKIEKDFLFLSKKYKILFPKETLSKSKLNICITFDDAYFDFYYIIFPILKKFKIKALLSVPSKYILNKTNIDPQIRLNVKNPFLNYKKAPFCTFYELKKMQDSGYVEIANHSYSHSNLIHSRDLEKEILFSKKILEKNLNKEISTFVYPFGKFNKKVHLFVKKSHKYIMRIGSSLNFSFNNFNNLTYRIVADEKNLKDILKTSKYPLYFFNFLKNSLRGR